MRKVYTKVLGPKKLASLDSQSVSLGAQLTFSEANTRILNDIVSKNPVAKRVKANIIEGTKQAINAAAKQFSTPALVAEYVKTTIFDEVLRGVISVYVDDSYKHKHQGQRDARNIISGKEEPSQAPLITYIAAEVRNVMQSPSPELLEIVKKQVREAMHSPKTWEPAVAAIASERMLGTVDAASQLYANKFIEDQLYTLFGYAVKVGPQVHNDRYRRSDEYVAGMDSVLRSVGAGIDEGNTGDGKKKARNGKSSKRSKGVSSKPARKPRKVEKPR